ncbi:MAG: thiamine-phosphate kinase [Candidatus Bathyarchaeota archaeon]|nr:thiamine-phosphate kinase [Candidatus Bathyarchaeota archaeon]
MATIAEVGERELISRIMRHLTLMPGMPVPNWDDVNAISLGDGRAVVLKTDMLVWKTDIPAGMTPFQAGRKAVVMNFSDLGSKGVQPLAFLAALGAPATTPADWVEEIAKGFEAGAREYGGYMVGGDTNEACDIIISGMAYGLAEERRLVLRGTSKPGDILATTGGFGNTTAGFKMLLEGVDAPKALRERLLKSVYMPRARVKAGIALAASGAATSSMDSSDGLAVSLHDLQKSSGNGFKLTNVPLTKDAEKFAELHKLDRAALALYGGEEYELVFTVKPDAVEEARKALRGAGADLIQLGVVTKDRKIVYVEDGAEKPVGKGGWEHFTGLK